MTSVSPGSTATSIPTTRPTTSAAKLAGASTCTKPPASCCSTSHTSADPQQLHQQQRHRCEWSAADRQRQIDDLHEDEHEHERACECDGGDDRPAPVSARPRQRGDVEDRVDEEAK